LHTFLLINGLLAHLLFALHRYTYYTTPKFGNCKEDPDDGPVNRLSRWTYLPESRTIDPDSEVVFFETASLAKRYHNSGKIEFGKDGYLYVTCGDGGTRDDGQEVDSLFGSIIRLTDTGEIPPTNPFANDPDGVRCNENGKVSGKKCQELYAIGVRNAWRLSMDPNTEGNKVRFFFNDVGASSWEEISEGGDDWMDATEWGWKEGLQNFGWPVREGPCKWSEDSNCDDFEGYIHPVHFYAHEGGGAATAGSFVPNGVWGPEYDNHYFWADFVFGEIRMWDSTAPKDHCLDDCNPVKSDMPIEPFTDYPNVITMRFGPDVGGKTALYFTSSSNGGVLRQVVCQDCAAVTDDSTAGANATLAPTAAPTAYVPPVRPDGEGGYPGILFPWSSGADCTEGYDFCGVLEFCMADDGVSYGYRLPCVDEVCVCESIPGPLIRLVTGNVYKLTLRNAGTEVTNLHTHGLHIVGDGDSDDVLRQVMGGGNCLDYTWDIKSDHPGGTYWYHAHHHGISEKQVGGGAFGMLIVEDNVALNPVVPSWAANELLLQVSVFVYTSEMFANGRTNEVIDIAANQWYRLRVSMVSANAVPYNFTFDDQGMCDIHKVASDGIWRSQIPGPKSSVWELTGASRADFAIRCNTPNALVPVFYRDDELIAQIWVGPAETNVHTMEEWTPNRPYSISDMSGETVPEENMVAVRLGFDYVNDGEWDPVVPLAIIGYDQVHEWTLMSTNLHPFHIHLYHMQVATSGGCGAHEEGEFYDTIAAEGNCTVRFRTADIGQRCVLHCHVLFHEDNGSMSWVNVTGEGMPLNTAQSLEYACAAGDLPTRPPTTPTGAPTTSPNRCIPGFLGIASGGDPLLDDETYVNEKFGVFIIQQGDGNLVVKRGTPEVPGEVVWASMGVLDGADDFFTQLNSDSNLITYIGTPEASPRQELWSTESQAAETAKAEGEYFLGIDCNSEIVSVYAGSWENPSDSVSVWNSAPTSPPTTSPTVSPTTAPPTTPPTASATDAPTAAPVFVSLTAGSSGTSSAGAGAGAGTSCLAMLALFLVNLALL